MIGDSKRFRISIEWWLVTRWCVGRESREKLVVSVSVLANQLYFPIGNSYVVQTRPGHVRNNMIWNVISHIMLAYVTITSMPVITFEITLLDVSSQNNMLFHSITIWNNYFTQLWNCSSKRYQLTGLSGFSPDYTDARCILFSGSFLSTNLK